MRGRGEGGRSRGEGGEDGEDKRKEEKVKIIRVFHQPFTSDPSLVTVFSTQTFVWHYFSCVVVRRFTSTSSPQNAFKTHWYP